MLPTVVDTVSADDCPEPPEGKKKAKKKSKGKKKDKAKGSLLGSLEQGKGAGVVCLIASGRAGVMPRLTCLTCGCACVCVCVCVWWITIVQNSRAGKGGDDDLSWNKKKKSWRSWFSSKSQSPNYQDFVCLRG